jgi:uncharacterized FAD-dependent dehydrogenase
MKTRGCQFLANKRVTDFLLDENTGTISAVACGDKIFTADAVIFAVGITALQRIVYNRCVSMQIYFFAMMVEVSQ